MSWLPILQNRSAVTVKEQERPDSGQLVVMQEVSQALTTIATWLTSPDGLSKLLAQHVEATARTGAIKEILGGLAAHDGRNALDARVMTQNAVEVFHHVEAMMDKMKEGLKAKNSETTRDPELHDGESDYQKWKEKQNESK